MRRSETKRSEGGQNIALHQIVWVSNNQDCLSTYRHVAQQRLEHFKAHSGSMVDVQYEQSAIMPTRHVCIGGAPWWHACNGSTQMGSHCCPGSCDAFPACSLVVAMGRGRFLNSIYTNSRSTAPAAVTGTTNTANTADTTNY